MDTQVRRARGVPSQKPRRYLAEVRFRVLGSLEASADDGPIALGGPKQRLVLAHLLLRANQVVPSDHLIDAVWGEEPPETAKGTLQAYISRLRSVLGGDRLEGRAPGYLFRIDREELDATRFEALLQEARGATSEPKVVLDVLGEALELWRGPALADLADEPSVQGEIARLEELRLSAIEEQISARLDLGEHAGVVAELEAATIAHPLRERLWSQLVLALYRSGRQAEALAAFDRARRLLADELGIDPSRELQDLHERVLRQDESLQLPGEPLRGYRLLDKVGEGAFGSVYRAIQPQVEREVAIKAIHAELANQPDFVRRFEREAQLVARLEHPHIVPLYDYWREPDAAYLIMRYLRGGSLADLLNVGPLEPERAAGLLDQIGAALAAAHRQGVVHRDVKPGNVLLDEEGNAYLSDFGIALETGAPEQTAGTMIRGTPAYLSPEQIRLEQTTRRSDIYALGIVLFEMLTAEHPFPGTSLTLLLDQHLNVPVPSARALRPELPPAVDAAIARATAKDPAARFDDVLELCAAFRAAVEGTAARVAIPGEIRNPYKGLRAFLEADSADFFGRELLTRRLLERLAERGAPRFLCVVGPSGSGKSSVVRAGLVPAIRRGVIPGSERWYVVDLVPGGQPLRELERVLLGVGVDPPPSLLEELEADERGLARAVDRLLPDPDAELLIVLDQLEEMFTMVHSEAVRAHVLESLRVAATEPSSRIRIVATLRADFFDQPLSVRGFGELLAARTEAITPMSPEELERAIVGPAERVGLDVEPGLVAAMVADVVDRPGGLPLLQYALTELADRDDVHALTLSAYRRIGGVSGALARRAEHLYDGLAEDGRGACRHVFLRLVAIGEGTDARRRVRRSELAADEATQAVIEAFGRHRLLSFDRDPATREPTIEIAHEALLHAWTRLRRWVDEARDDIRTEHQLSLAASEWDDGGQEPSFLVRGARLERFASWAETTSVPLSSLGESYLEAATRQRDEEVAAARAAQERERNLERRSLRRTRALVAVLTAGLLVAGTLTVIAVNRNASANRATRLATARELAGKALAAVEPDPDLATLLALESIDTSAPDDIVVPDAERTLRSLPSLTIEGLGDGGSLEASLTPDLSRVAVVAEDGPTAVWDLASGQPGRRVFVVPTRVAAAGSCPTEPEGVTFPRCDAVFHAALSPDGALLATGHSDRWVRVWDVEAGRELRAIDLYTLASGPVPSRSDLLSSPYGASDPAGFLSPSVGFSPDGRYLWTQAKYGDLVVWDLETTREVIRAPDELRIGQPGSPNGTVAFSPDGRYVAFGGQRYQIWDLDTRELVVDDPEINNFFWSRVSFSRDGLASDGVLLWDLHGGGREQLDTLSDNVATDVAFSPDGTRLAIVIPSTVLMWDVDSKELGTLADLLTSPPTAMAWAPDSRSLAVGSADGIVRVWDVDTGRVTVTIPAGQIDVIDLAFTQDGERLAVVTKDGRVALHIVRLVDLTTFARTHLTVPTDEECRRYLHEPCPSSD